MLLLCLSKHCALVKPVPTEELFSAHSLSTLILDRLQLQGGIVPAGHHKAIFAAGLDIVLHCHGIMEQMTAVASCTPELNGKALERAQRAIQYARKPDASDEAEIREEFQRFFEAVA